MRPSCVSGDGWGGCSSPSAERGAVLRGPARAAHHAVSPATHTRVLRDAVRQRTAALELQIKGRHARRAVDNVGIRHRPLLRLEHAAKQPRGLALVDGAVRQEHSTAAHRQRNRAGLHLLRVLQVHTRRQDGAIARNLRDGVAHRLLHSAASSLLAAARHAASTKG